MLPLRGRARRLDVTLRMSNPLPVEKGVALICGSQSLAVTFTPGEPVRQTSLMGCDATLLEIQCVAHRPDHIIEGSTDARSLGIAVHDIEVHPASAYQVHLALARGSREGRWGVDRPGVGMRGFVGVACAQP